MNAGSRKEVREAEKLAKVREESRRNFLIAAMSTREGRTWLYDLLEFCHLFSDPFSGQALTEAYLKGERNVGLKLFAEITQWAPDNYIQMIKEANSVRSTAIAELSRREDAGWDAEGAFLDDPEPGA
jgi:hypothetical protein